MPCARSLAATKQPQLVKQVNVLFVVAIVQKIRGVYLSTRPPSSHINLTNILGLILSHNRSNLSSRPLILASHGLNFVKIPSEGNSRLRNSAV